MTLNNADERRIARAAEAGLHRKQGTDAVGISLLLAGSVCLFAGPLGWAIAAVLFPLAIVWYRKRTNGNL